MPTPHDPSRELPGVTPPLQGRSLKAFESILDAAETLLQDRDLERLRVEDLLAEADVSVGSFYARFEGKQALLGALVERYRLIIEADVARPAEVDAGDLEEACRLIVHDRVQHYRGRRGLMRCLSLESRIEGRFSTQLRSLAQLMNDWLKQVFRHHYAEIGHADPGAAVVKAFYFLGAVCRDRLLFGTGPHAASVAVPLSKLEAELTELLLGYLRGGESTR